MRRPPPGEPPQRRFRRDVPRPEGPFERLLKRKPERDPAPIIIGGTIAFLALVIVLVFVISSLSGGDGGGGGGDDKSVEIAPGVRARNASLPSLPPGLAAFSDYIELEAEEDTAAEIGLQVKQKVENGDGLGFYTFEKKRWQRVAPISEIEQDGKVVFGQFPSVPANLAVLRVLSETYQVAASLPAGASLHPDAAPNIVSPRDFAPVDDGSIAGSATSLPSERTFLVIPTIVGSGEDGSAVVNDILADEDLRADHVKAIVSLVEEGGFDGIDLEYPAVDADLKDEFTSFVKALSDGLHGKNKKLSLTAPPPGGSKERQAYDWKELGQRVDMIKVLPIADPVTYWEAMPDALSRMVDDVGEPRKVLLVLSPFSVEDVGDISRPVGFVQAMALAAEATVREPGDPNDIEPGTTVRLVARNLDEAEGASPLRWNDDAAAVSFALGGTERRRIYIENSFSFGFKLEMVQAYGLAGVSVSDGSAESDVANIWGSVRDFLTSGTVTLRRPNDNAFVPIWQAPDGGDLGAGQGTTATWVAPQAGQYHLVLVVSDGERRFGRPMLLEVKKGAEPEATPVVTFPPETPTPTASPAETPSPSPTPGAQSLEVGLLADTDGNKTFTNEEHGTVGDTVAFRLTIDNNSSSSVQVFSISLSFGDKVISVSDCTSVNTGKNVLDVTLDPDDGDPGGFGSGGLDEVVCEFSIKPDGPGDYPSVITVVVKDGEGNQISATDGAQVTIAPPST